MGNCCSPGCRLWCLWWCLFVLFFFPRGVLDEILNLIESVSEGFPSYFCWDLHKRGHPRGFNSQKRTQFSLRSHSRYLVEKRTAHNKTLSNTSPATARWTPFPIQMVTHWPNIKHLFYLFSIFISNKINKTLLHTTSKTNKEPKQKSRLGTASNKITKGLGLVRDRPTLALGSASVHQTKQLRTTKTKRIKHKQKAKQAAGNEGQMGTMLESHTRQTDRIDITSLKRAREKCKNDN